MMEDTEKEKALQTLKPALSGTDIQLLACLRHKPDSSVFAATRSDQPVILKQFHADGAAQLVKMKAELRIVAQQMEGTSHRINRLLDTIPQLGLAVLEHAGDVRLSHAIAVAGSNRTAIMAQAADWLVAYVGPRRRTEPFRSRRWLEKTFGHGQALSPIQSRAATILRKMARQLAGAPFTRAATHGDFVSINAMWQNGQIVGVDVQGQAWLPLARDMARFLVWQELHARVPGPWVWGLAQQDVQTFLQAPLISTEESETILPYFIGLELVHRLFELQSRPRGLAIGEAALIRWCDQV